MSEMHIIVGAGQAGGWAAMGMRQAGFAGRILLIGEEPWRPYERPPLSKAMLTAPEEPAPAYFHPAERYAEQAIELMLGTAAEEILPGRTPHPAAATAARSATTSCCSPPAGGRGTCRCQGASTRSISARWTRRARSAPGCARREPSSASAPA